jgi:hypothetical protein
MCAVCGALFEVSEAKPKSVGKAVMSLLLCISERNSYYNISLHESLVYVMLGGMHLETLARSFTKMAV